MCSTRSFRTVFGAAIAVLFLLSQPAGVVASGRHSGGHGHHGHNHGSGTGQPGHAADVSRVIRITMTDNAFAPKTITVKKGQTVRFIVSNSGTLVHEFNIGTSSMHAQHRKEMAAMVEHGVLEADRINHARMKMDMGGGKTMAHDDPNSVLLEPRKTAELIWKFPADATLEFACNVPRHYEAGMKGRIVLE